MEREKSFSSRDEMKKYLVQNEIQYLFEGILTGLMYVKPKDPLHYLEKCVDLAKRKGISQCNWEEFVKMYEAEMKNDQSLHPGSANERTPSLPSSANGRTRQEKHMAFKTQQYK
ncbi:uncharacterized protein LOC142335176 [Convolutriloba macropyga]|uniref:uncharacterized protein LOC142335176 n=1 Tax=Convolutriloba macropyga TaxID=536237 RepID=UPI003F524718